MSVIFKVELEREDGGRWLAEVVELPGVLAYGASEDEAIARVQALALRVVADRLEHDEAGREYLDISFEAACVNGPARERGSCLRRCCGWGGSSSARPALTRSWRAPDGRIWSSHSTTATRSARACWRVSRSTGGCGLRISREGVATTHP